MPITKIIRELIIKIADRIRDCMCPPPPAKKINKYLNEIKIPGIKKKCSDYRKKL